MGTVVERGERGKQGDHGQAGHDGGRGEKGERGERGRRAPVQRSAQIGFAILAIANLMAFFFVWQTAKHLEATDREADKSRTELRSTVRRIQRNELDTEQARAERLAQINTINEELCLEIEQLKTDRRVEIQESAKNFQRDLDALGIRWTPQLQKIKDAGTKAALLRVQREPCPRAWIE
jgi:hypothetical protein